MQSFEQRLPAPSQFQKLHGARISSQLIMISCLQETQWEAPVEGYLPAPEAWLVGQQADWLACQDVTKHESAEDTITQDSAASATADHPSASTSEAHDSLSRLALDNAVADSTPDALADALADAPAQSPLESFVTSDSTLPAAEQTAAGNATHMPAVAQSAAAPHSCRQCAVAPASASASASAEAVVGKILGAAMPASRVESTGIMASIPVPQGRHIRYNSTEADSDSASTPAQSATLQEATAQPPQSTDCELNSVDQQDVLDAVADLGVLACTDASDVYDKVTNGCGRVAGNAMVVDAMQGVLATTVVSPAALEQATQASSISADLADAPAERETSARSSTLHVDSCNDSQLREACISEADYAQGAVEGVRSATASDPLAGACSIDSSGGSQPQQDCCSPLQAGRPSCRNS